MTESILITGSNRGIGLELVRQYAEAGWRVYACCRQPDTAKQLNTLARNNPQISIHKLDVSNSEQIQALVSELKNQPIDVLFNNAGIYGPDNVRFGNTNEEQWLKCFRINTIAPMKILEALIDNITISKHKLVATMSSKMGSMADNTSGGSYLYRSSKAAVNAVMKSAAIDLKPRNIKIAILHPGWVLTDMGGPNAEITVEKCVNQLRRNLEQVNMANSGSFFEIDGSIIPW